MALANLRTNTTVTVKRKGMDVPGLGNTSVLILPAGPEIIALQEIPATKAFEVYFSDVVEVKEQDYLHEPDGKKYRVVGVSHYRTPRSSHTQASLESMWGT